jgi:hypothetical protein
MAAGSGEEALHGLLQVVAVKLAILDRMPFANFSFVAPPSVVNFPETPVFHAL